MDGLDAGEKSSGWLLDLANLAAIVVRPPSRISKFILPWSVDTLAATIVGDTLESQASNSNLLRESIFVSKKFTLEAIVQVARSIGTKSLDTKVGFLV
jgi:hypothetical protein